MELRSNARWRSGSRVISTHCYGITDVSALGGVYTLDVSYYNRVRDVSALDNVHKICIQISDVRALGEVHNLDMKHCYGITDVSTLGGDISYCHRIRNVSALGNVVTLNMRGYYRIYDVSALSNVRTLNISCRGIIDVSVLDDVHSLIDVDYDSDDDCSNY
jgi:hypothetical protein